MFSKYPYTFDSDVNLRPPTSALDAKNMLMFNVGGKKQPYEATMLTPMLSDQVDWKAPGVREQMMNPPISLGPFRSSTYDVQRPMNAAPIPDYNDTLGQNNYLFGPWAQRTGADNFQMLQETALLDNIMFKNYGQWSSPHTGFSALKDIKPNSTRAFVQ